MLAERMHWTLEYIDSLDWDDYRRTLIVLDAVDKARAFVNKRGK